MSSSPTVESKDPLIRLVNIARATLEEIADGPYEVSRKVEWLIHLAGKAELEIMMAKRKLKRASTVPNRG